MVSIVRRLVPGSAFLFLAGAVQAGVVCHVTYGGETRPVLGQAVSSPYEVPAVAIGSYFRFRLVVQTAPTDLASVKVYVYADQDGGPVQIQQLSYPYPPPTGMGRGFGFTGKQVVYEPVRDGELQYWCEYRRGRGQA